MHQFQFGNDMKQAWNVFIRYSRKYLTFFPQMFFLIPQTKSNEGKSGCGKRFDDFSHFQSLPHGNTGH